MGIQTGIHFLGGNVECTGCDVEVSLRSIEKHTWWLRRFYIQNDSWKVLQLASLIASSTVDNTSRMNLGRKEACFSIFLTFLKVKDLVYPLNFMSMAVTPEYNFMSPYDTKKLFWDSTSRFLPTHPFTSHMCDPQFFFGIILATPH